MTITIKAADPAAAVYMISQIAPLNFQKTKTGGLSGAGSGVEYFVSDDVGFAKIYQRHQLTQITIIGKPTGAMVDIHTDSNRICGKPTIDETDRLTDNQIAQIRAALQITF